MGWGSKGRASRVMGGSGRGLHVDDGVERREQLGPAAIDHHAHVEHVPRPHPAREREEREARLPGLQRKREGGRAGER